MITFTSDITLISIAGAAFALIFAIIALVCGLAPQRRVGRVLETLTEDYTNEFQDEEPISEEAETESEDGETTAEEVTATEELSAEEAQVEQTETQVEMTPTAVDTSAFPMVTVIAYTPEDGELLEEFIESVIGQDYPNFELVLVLDAGAETRAMFVEKYADIKNLYLTFIPPGSQNLSRRKLATTLGMKAAKGEIAVTTSSNCRIPSTRWLSGMMAPFIESRFTEVVLGYTSLDLSEIHGARRWYREWFSATTAMQWIGFALDGHPYRGDGLNLAFRKSVFFDHKGYARTINIHDGDDDLFIDEISNASNTKVVLDRNTVLTAEWGELASKMWVARRERYDFTSRWLPRRPFLLAGLLSASQWCVLTGCVVCALAGLPNLIPAIFALLFIALFFTLEILAYRKAAAVLRATRLWWSLPVFMLWKPIGNFLFRMRHRSERVRNFTWQRKRH